MPVLSLAARQVQHQLAPVLRLLHEEGRWLGGVGGVGQDGRQQEVVVVLPGDLVRRHIGGAREPHLRSRLGYHLRGGPSLEPDPELRFNRGSQQEQLQEEENEGGGGGRMPSRTPLGTIHSGGGECRVT